ncbi:bifunctional metallophosphatase/5'-nucleotidase [Altererythrobacter lutimaris]|uniref:Bifunctional metallophosphatase/5'-nucleotidase n=1 Tax=Altererythrobacter lutimaris TaxID=2743979 RepID=A0A850HAW6_9SPHN|nr:bifunctional metallophosphatase/5'-nucleotidase [Altererythrobacter lutimaris]NVE95173.1 bifunctional metallophosphatase/5'-nucleotidase [Altererythrobacter lutimaris]
MKKLATLGALFALTACAAQTSPETISAMPSPEPFELRVIGLNDFHGNIEPVSRARIAETGQEPKRIAAGGAAYLAAAVSEARQQAEHSLVIAAGDLIGASPLASSYFLDEPAIGAMNRLGLDFNAVGNHEFDRGWEELTRIQEGGCEKHTLREPCGVEKPYPGADFQFLAANVVMPDGNTLFSAYGTRIYGEGEAEVTVGVIGLTLEDTPSLVEPTGVAGLTFAPEAATINASVEALATQGVEAIIVSIHQGLYTDVGYNDKSCGGVAGPLIDILKKVDPRIDLVISGHTHRAYVCDFAKIDPERDFWVVSAASAGTLFTDIVLELDPATGDARVISADNKVVQVAGESADPAYRQYRPDAEIAAYVARYVEASREAAERPVGRIAVSAGTPEGVSRDSSLGNAIADAQLFATREAGAQIAFMNNGGIRTSLRPADDGTITYGDIFAVQPFGNQLVTRTFTGAQLLAVLEQQFDSGERIIGLQVSEGFAFSYDMSKPEGERLVGASFNNEPIDPAKSYRVTMNSFLAAGGDGFTLFKEGADSVVGPVDLDAFELWLAQVDVRLLPETGRITELTPRP